YSSFPGRKFIRRYNPAFDQAWMADHPAMSPCRQHNRDAIPRGPVEGLVITGTGPACAEGGAHKAARAEQDRCIRQAAIASVVGQDDVDAGPAVDRDFARAEGCLAGMRLQIPAVIDDTAVRQDGPKRSGV